MSWRDDYPEPPEPTTEQIISEEISASREDLSNQISDLQSKVEHLRKEVRKWEWRALIAAVAFFIAGQVLGYVHL